jgi:hypothetical protein
VFWNKKHFEKQPLPHSQTPSNLLGTEKKNKEKILNLKKKTNNFKTFHVPTSFFCPYILLGYAILLLLKYFLC